jgi:aminoglycoside phosphotransferase (APT) family kinase protein
MSDTPSNHPFDQIARRIDPHARLLRSWPLTGGVSAQVTALEIEPPDGQTRKVIVRQHGAIDLQQNPRIAADEFKLLRILQSEGLPAPAPYYADESGAIFPTPYIVVEYIEGTTEFVPADVAGYVRQFAATLARIHCLDVSKVDVSFLPNRAERDAETFRQRPPKMDDSIGEGQIRDALETVWPLPHLNPSALLHGDFWPGNILWRDGGLVGVIDWEDAVLGDPLSDLGSSRLEILWAFGIETLHQFTGHYQSIMTDLNYAHLPYWDLRAALRPAFKIAEWAGDAAREKVMRERHTWFVAQAFDGLSTRS